MLGYISWLCGTNLHLKIKMTTFEEKMEGLCSEGKLAGVVLVAGDQSGKFLCVVLVCLLSSFLGAVFV